MNSLEFNLYNIYQAFCLREDIQPTVPKKEKALKYFLLKQWKQITGRGNKESL